jgi:hypothetical protein
MTRAWHLFVTAAIVLVFGLTTPPASVRGDDSITLQMSVDAGEDFGNPLTYRWRATDGRIVDQNSPTTDWTLPNGPGIHFAYVLVSNGKGGYTEGRIAVNTDSNPTTMVVPRNQYPAAPPASIPTAVSGQIKGMVILDDASVCGTRNPFFGVNVNATVQFADNGGNLLGQAMVLNPYAYGQFAITPPNANASRLIFTCENATLAVNSFSSTDPSANIFIIRGTAQPQVKSMSATLNGTDIGIFPVPPVVPQGILPSDYLAGRQSDNLIGPPPRFLAFKGLDTRLGSCQYYKSVGAVEDCDAAGNYQGKTLTFDAWRQAVQIDEFCNPYPDCLPLPFQAKAVFINKTDLNLTRDHHSIQPPGIPGPPALAAYVCNHSGPTPNSDSDPTGLFPSPAAVDAAIDAVLHVDADHRLGHNLIACVAMDRLPITSVTGQRVKRHSDFEPFTRFLTFGPNGDLLPSVNLDGNGEKFVPGACVACHGGTNYFALTDATHGPSQPNFGGFPETGVLDGADLGSYFLPYDVDNFAFHSSRHPYTKDDQQSAIFDLNYIAWQTNYDIAGVNANRPAQPTQQQQAFNNLFHGWYPNSSTFVSRTDPQAYVPSTYQDRPFYLNVVAASCRTCHIAMDERNFDIFDPVNFAVEDLVCGQGLAELTLDPMRYESSYLMPNSRVTFDRFWLSTRKFVSGQPANTVNQPAALGAHYQQRRGMSLSCHLP